MMHVQFDVLTNILGVGSSRTPSTSTSSHRRAASKSQRSSPKAIQCSSGAPATHKALRDIDTRRGGNLRHHDIFVCQGAVDTVKLLHLSRSDLLSRAKSYGANALMDEQWSCKIRRLKSKKEVNYRVSIRYSAAIARCQPTASDDLRHPVQLHAAKTIDGLMCILHRSE